MALKSLTAAERETIILTSDADDSWLVTTHQKPRVNQLEKMVASGNAEKLEDLTWGNQAGGQYRIPAKMVTLRNPAPKGSRKTRIRPEIEVRCKGKTLTGRPCNAIPSANGYCFQHKDQVKKRKRG